MKMGKNNPLASPFPKAADALKFTRQGLPCSRQCGREGGCSIRLPLLPRPAPRDFICMCNSGISIYLDDCYADLWYGELGLFPGPPQPSLCEGGSLMRGKQHAAQLLVIYQLVSDQEPLQAAFPADSNTCSLCVKQKCISLSRDYKREACLSTLPFSIFSLIWERLFTLRGDTQL